MIGRASQEWTRPDQKWTRPNFSINRKVFLWRTIRNSERNLFQFKEKFSGGGKLGAGWRERPGALGGRGGGYLPTCIEGKVHWIWHKDSTNRINEINESIVIPM